MLGVVNSRQERTELGLRIDLTAIEIEDAVEKNWCEEQQRLKSIEPAGLLLSLPRTKRTVQCYTIIIVLPALSPSETM